MPFQPHIELNATNNMMHIFNKISFVIDPHPLRVPKFSAQYFGFLNTQIISSLRMRRQVELPYKATATITQYGRKCDTV